MGFLNENQQQVMFKSDRVKKELTVIPKSKGVSSMLMQQFSFKHNTDSSGKSKQSSIYNSHAKTSSNKKANGCSRNNKFKVDGNSFKTQDFLKVKVPFKQDIVIIKPNKEAKNKFQDKPVLIRDFTDDMQGTYFGITL